MIRRLLEECGPGALSLVLCGWALYAQQIEANPRAYLAYHAWQVDYITPRGDLWLEEGYGT